MQEIEFPTISGYSFSGCPVDEDDTLMGMNKAGAIVLIIFIILVGLAALGFIYYKFFANSDSKKISARSYQAKNVDTF